MSTPTPVTLALDWTPNTTHIGFYVAAALGLDHDAGIALRLTTPEDDGYTLTPAVKLARGLADFALAPSETAISFALQPDKPRLVAVATLLQHDTSAIAVPADGPVQRPAQLDGRRYASYAARYERAIVQALVRADGGRGEFEEVQPARLSAPEMLDSGDADATWIFSHWEGVRAARRGRPYRQFCLGDWGLVYGHSPLLLARADRVQARPATVDALLQAAAAGWTLAAQDPDRAAALLCQAAAHPTLADTGFVQASARALAGAILDEQGRWGRMQPARWLGFVQWLESLGQVAPGAVDVQALYRQHAEG